jgi:hypothetical protein
MHTRKNKSFVGKHLSSCAMIRSIMPLPCQGWSTKECMRGGQKRHVRVNASCTNPNVSYLCNVTTNARIIALRKFISVDIKGHMVLIVSGDRVILVNVRSQGKPVNRTANITDARNMAKRGGAGVGRKDITVSAVRIQREK